MLKLYDLTIEYKKNPLGLDEVQPRFSWKLQSDEQNVRQAARRIVVESEGKTVWDSGKVETEESILQYAVESGKTSHPHVWHIGSRGWVLQYQTATGIGAWCTPAYGCDDGKGP